MRGILLGTLIGLIVGVIGAFAYNTYLGDGAELADVQTQLASASTDLTKANQGTIKLKSEADALSAEVKQLSTHNDELKHQVDELKASSTANSDNTATANSNPMGGFMKAAMDQQYQQKLLVFKTRLHLTPEQEAAVKAAMDGEAKMAESMLAGGKFDPEALKNAATDPNKPKGVEQTMNDILTPDQKTIYKQMQNDEKNSAVEMLATVQLNQMAPALQLTETQKDQVFNALSQLQSNAMDPNTYKNNPPNPATMLEDQAKAKEDALAKILTPEQLAIYHQQAQSELEMQKTMMQKFTPPATATPPPTPAPTQ